MHSEGSDHWNWKWAETEHTTCRIFLNSRYMHSRLWWPLELKMSWNGISNPTVGIVIDWSSHFRNHGLRSSLLSTSVIGIKSSPPSPRNLLISDSNSEVWELVYFKRFNRILNVFYCHVGEKKMLKNILHTWDPIQHYLGIFSQKTVLCVKRKCNWKQKCLVVILLHSRSYFPWRFSNIFCEYSLNRKCSKIFSKTYTGCFKVRDLSSTR